MKRRRGAEAPEPRAAAPRAVHAPADPLAGRRALDPARPLPPAVRTALSGTLVLLLAHSWIYRFLCDDAYISFRFARNLARGFGLVFNPGFERVEGYSNFLWTVLLAAFDRVGLAPERVAIPLGLLLTVALWAVVVRATLARRAAFPHDGWLVVPPLLLALVRTVAVWSTSGLETRAFELLVVWGAVRLAGEVDAQRAGRAPGRPWGAVLLGLAGLTRPDGVMVGGLVLGAGLAALGRDGLRPRTVLARAGAWLALVAAHQAFRLAYYGDWFPNTYYAKVNGRLQWGMGFEYLWAFALEYGAFLWVPLVVMGARRAWRQGASTLTLLAGAAVLPHLLYVTAIGGDHFEYRPLGLWFPFAVLFAGEALASLAVRPRGVWLAGAALAALLGFTVLLPWRSHLEFPAVYSSGFPGDIASRGPESERYLDPARHPITRLPLVDAWAGAHRRALFAITSRFAGVRQEEHRLFLAMVEAEADTLRAQAGRGLLPRDLYIAINCVGVIPYRTGFRTLDRHGLTDREVARRPFATDMVAHGKYAPYEMGRTRGVDLWFDDPALLTAPFTSQRFLRGWLDAREGQAEVVALEGEGDTWLVAELPMGLEAAARRLPRFHAWPLADSASRARLRPRLIEAWRAKLAGTAEDAEVQDALGLLLVEEGRAEEALAAYQELARLRPGDPDALANLEGVRRWIATRRRTGVAGAR